MKYGLLLSLLLIGCAFIKADDESADDKCGCQKPTHKIESQEVQTETEACPLEAVQPVTATCTETVCTITEAEKCPCSHVKPKSDIPDKIETQEVQAETEACPLEAVQPVTAACTETICTITEAEKCPCNIKPRSDVPDKCPCSVKPRTACVYNIYQYLHNQCPGMSPVKCPCSKPHHKYVATRVCSCIANNPKPRRIEESLEKCGCSNKPKQKAKDSTDGAELFIKATEAIMNCVTGGIVAHNTGNLEAGLAYVIDGIKEFINIASKSKNPEQATQELYKFVASFDQQEMEQLLQASNAHAILQAEKKTA